MDIKASLYHLANTNNGFFKSEKQACFLINQLVLNNGEFTEWFSFGENNGASSSRSVFFKWDEKGITEIKTVATKSKKVCIKFTRQTEQQLAEAKENSLAEEKQRIAEMIDYKKQEITFLDNAKNEEIDQLNIVIKSVIGTPSENLIDFLQSEIIRKTSDYERKINVILEEIKQLEGNF